jgi:CheY-like chemotaxis protein
VGRLRMATMNSRQHMKLSPVTILRKEPAAAATRFEISIRSGGATLRGHPLEAGHLATILLVDDDAALRALIEQMLTRAGHAVTTASDGAKALRLLETTSFDLVLTDLVMPDVEGLTVLRALRRTTSPPKVIAMSGGGRGSAPDYLEMATMLGAAATLAKPFTQKDLVETIARVLGAS